MTFHLKLLVWKQNKPAVFLFFFKFWLCHLFSFYSPSRSSSLLFGLKIDCKNFTFQGILFGIVPSLKRSKQILRKTKQVQFITVLLWQDFQSVFVPLRSHKRSVLSSQEGLHQRHHVVDATRYVHHSARHRHLTNRKSLTKLKKYSFLFIFFSPLSSRSIHGGRREYLFSDSQFEPLWSCLNANVRLWS